MIEMHRETEQLGAYALGALDEHEAAEMAAHIEGCPTCRRELAELESVRDLLGELPPEAMLDGPPRTATCCCSGHSGRCGRRNVRP